MRPPRCAEEDHSVYLSVIERVVYAQSVPSMQAASNVEEAPAQVPPEPQNAHRAVARQPRWEQAE